MDRLFQNVAGIIRDERLQARLAFALVWTFLVGLVVLASVQASA